MNEILNFNIVEEQPINLKLDFQGEILNPITDDSIQNAVNDYFEKNPIIFDETDPTVSEWAKQPNKPEYAADEVGAVPTDRTIAGIDLIDDIAAEELQKVLNVVPYQIGDYPPTDITPGQLGEFYLSITDKNLYCMVANGSDFETGEDTYYWKQINISNLITSINVNNTHQQIPSAKAVYDAIDELKGTIPNISEWAQKETKPQYTADEIGAVPIERKIAGIDLKDNITVSELQEKLGTYPPVVFHREPVPRETELKGKVGQIGILTYSYNTKLKIYKCTNVSYTGSRYEYTWQCINWLDGVHIDHTSGQFPENMNSGSAGTMVYKFNTKTLYFFNGSTWTQIPLNINLANSFKDAADDQIPTVKAIKDYFNDSFNSIVNGSEVSW